MGYDIFASIISSGLVSFLLRGWISERLKQSIKNEYTTQNILLASSLKGKTDAELESIKNSLGIVSLEHQIKFSKLHEKRAEVIAETYSLLKTFQTNVHEYGGAFLTAKEKPISELRKDAIESFQRFKKYYTLRVIYFPKETAEKLEAIKNEYSAAFGHLLEITDMSKEIDQDKWVKNSFKITIEITNAVTSLESDFRRILGDDHESSQTKA